MRWVLDALATAPEDMEGCATPRKRCNDRLFLANWSAPIRAFIVGGMQPRALAQHFLETGRATVFLEQVAECLVSQLLEGLRDQAASTFPCYGLTNVVVPGPMPVICTMTSSSLAPSKCTAFAGCFM